MTTLRELAQRQGGGKRKWRRTVRAVQPAPADEAALVSFMLAQIVTPWREAVTQLLLPAFRADVTPEALQSMCDSHLRSMLAKRVTWEGPLQSWGRTQVRRYIARMAAGVRAATGVDVAGELQVSTFRQVIAVEVASCESMMAQMATDLGGVIGRAFIDESARRGLTVDAPASRGLLSRIGTGLAAAGRRVRQWARNTTYRLNSRANQTTARVFGLSSYVWRTQLDDRVRGNPGGRYPRAIPSHWAREEVVYRWDTPPAEDAYDGHPGVPPNCRCTAELLTEDEADSRRRRNGG